MADESLRTELRVDYTGNGFEGAALAAQQYEAAIAKAARNMNMTAPQYRQHMLNMEAAARAASGAVNQQTDQIGRQTSAIHNLGGELTGLAARYISVGAAATAAMRGFDLAMHQDTALRRIQVQTGETRQRLDALVPTFRNLGRETGQTSEQIISAFEALREGGNLTVQQTEMLLPTIAKAARGAAVAPAQMGAAMGALMRQFKLNGNDVDAVMNSLSKGATDYQLDVKDIVRGAPELAAAMKSWGFTGVQGVNEMMAALAAIRPEFNSTGEAVTGLTSLINNLGNEGDFAAKLGTNTEGLQRSLRQAASEGKNVLLVYAQWAKELQQNTGGQVAIEQMFSRRTLPVMRAMINELDKIPKSIRDFNSASGDWQKNWGIMSKGPEADWDRLKFEVDDTLKSVEHLAGAINRAFGEEQKGLVAKLGDQVRELGSIMRGETNLLDEFKKRALDSVSPPAFLNETQSGKNIGGESRQDWLRRRDRNRNPFTDQSQRFRGMPRGNDLDPELWDRGSRTIKDLPVPIDPTLRGGGLQELLQGTEGTGEIKGSQGNDELTDDTGAMRTSLGNMERYLGDMWREGGHGGAGGGGTSSGGTNRGARNMGLGGVDLGGSEGAFGGSGGTGIPGLGGTGTGGLPRGGAGPSGGGFRDRFEEGRPPAPGTQGGGATPGGGEGRSGGVEPGTGQQLFSGGEGGLAADRAKFAAELQRNPGLRDKIAGIAAGEQGAHPRGTQAVIESMMNRASMKGTSLAQEARTTGEGGYYAGYNPRLASQRPDLYSKGIDQALGGSNVSNYATDNASQGLAAKHKRTGVFVPTGEDIHGETFFRPGTFGRGTTRDQAHYSAWRQRLQQAEQQQTAGGGTRSAGTSTPDTDASFTDPRISAGSVGGTGAGSVDQGSQQFLNERGPMMGPGMRGAPAPDNFNDRFNGEPGNSPTSSLEEARQIRAEMEEPIIMRTKMDASDSQFRRSSMRREADRELREERWDSYADIGAA